MKRRAGYVAAGAAATLVAEAALYVWAIKRAALRWLG
jgi:hypothetical protein